MRCKKSSSNSDEMHQVFPRAGGRTWFSVDLSDGIGIVQPFTLAVCWSPAMVRQLS